MTTDRTVWRRLSLFGLGFVCIAGASILGARPAWAHAEARDMTPAPESTVMSVRTVSIGFDQPVRLIGSGLQVRSATGRLVVDVAPGSPARVIAAALPADLPAGVYAVGWTVLSGDSDVVYGSYRFRLERPGSAPGRRWTFLPLLAVGLIVCICGAVTWTLARRSWRLAAAFGIVLLSAAAVVMASMLVDRRASPVAVVLSPPRAGLTRVVVQLPSDLSRAKTTEMRLAHDRAHFWVDVPLVADGPGRFAANDVNLPIGGRWRVELTVMTGTRQTLFDTTVDVDGPDVAALHVTLRPRLIVRA